MPLSNQIFVPLFRALISLESQHSFLEIFSTAFFENISAEELSIVASFPDSSFGRIWCAYQGSSGINVNKDRIAVEPSTDYYKKVVLQAEILQNKSENATLQSSVFSKGNLTAFVCLPITSHDTVIGTLNVGRSKLDFNNQELQLIQTFTDLLALAFLYYKSKEDYNSIVEKLNEFEQRALENKERLTQVDHLMDSGKSILNQFYDLLNVLNHDHPHISQSTLNSFLTISHSISVSLSSLIRETGIHEKGGLTDCRKLIDELKETLGLDIKTASLSSLLLPVNYDSILQSLINISNQLKKTGHAGLSVVVLDNQVHFFLTSGEDTPDYLLQQEHASSNISDIDDPVIQIEIIKLRLLNAKIKLSKNGNRLDLDLAFDVVPSSEQIIPDQQAITGIDQILIVDDDDALRELLADILESRGYNVIASSDGYKALELIQQEKVSLVISDLEMPRINGIELAKRIKTLKPNLPIAIITGWGTELKENTSYFNYVLAKPFNLTEVLQLVENCLSINSTGRS